jgi:hypothetical protein
MHRLTRWIILTLLLTGAGFALWQRRQHTCLVAAIAALPRYTRELEALETANHSLRALHPTADDRARWAATHAEIVRLRVAARTEDAARESSNSAHFPLTETGSVFRPKLIATPDLKVRSEWQNKGIGTPSDTFETSCWAEAVGDIDTLVSTLAIDDTARANAKEVFDRLPLDQQTKFGSPERLIAMLQVGAGTEFAAIKVLDVVERSPGVVLLHTLWQYDDGRIRENTNVKLQQTTSGWQVPVTGKNVAELIQYRLRPAPPQDGPR